MQTWEELDYEIMHIKLMHSLTVICLKSMTASSSLVADSILSSRCPSSTLTMTRLASLPLLLHFKNVVSLLRNAPAAQCAAALDPCVAAAGHPSSPWNIRLVCALVISAERLSAQDVRVDWLSINSFLLNTSSSFSD